VQTFRLWNVSNVERVDLKLYYLPIKAKEKKLCLSLAIKSKDELYGWHEGIYQCIPLMGDSGPMNFTHKVHVSFHPISGAFTVRLRMR
jgi:hypothetical protein